MNKKNIIKIINKELTILTDIVDGMNEEEAIHAFELEMALSKTTDIYNMLKLLKSDNNSSTFEKESIPEPAAAITNKNKLVSVSKEEKPTPEPKTIQKEEVKHQDTVPKDVKEDVILAQENTDNKLELSKEKELAVTPAQETIEEKEEEHITENTTKEIIEKKDIEVEATEIIVENKEEEVKPKTEVASVTETKADVEPSKNGILADKFNEQKVSINDMLSSFKQDKNIAALLKDRPVKELKKAVKINDRIWYIQELFNKDAEEYSQTIETLDKLEDLDQALSHIFTKYNWDQNKKSTISFLELIYRRFSNIQ